MGNSEEPTYEELMEKKPSNEELLKATDEARAWYNDSVTVATNILVEMAKENKEFRDEVLESKGLGPLRIISEWDEERHEKLNSLDLSAFQASEVVLKAKKEIREENM